MTDSVNAVALTREYRVQGLTIDWVADAQKEGTRRGRAALGAHDKSSLSLADVTTPRELSCASEFFAYSTGNWFREAGLMGSTCSASTLGRGKGANNKEESSRAAHDQYSRARRKTTQALYAKGPIYPTRMGESTPPHSGGPPTSRVLLLETVFSRVRKRFNSSKRKYKYATVPTPRKRGNSVTGLPHEASRIVAVLRNAVVWGSSRTRARG